MQENKQSWPAEKIVAMAKQICGVKDFAQVPKIKFMAKIVSQDLENQALIRELYFAVPNHDFFKNWTKADRKHFDDMKPKSTTTIERKSS